MQVVNVYLISILYAIYFRGTLRVDFQPGLKRAEISALFNRFRLNRAKKIQ